MKRNVIKQGNDTLTVTLPRKWTRKYNIGAGDQVEVDVRDNLLEIFSKKIIDTKKVYFNFDFDDYYLIKWTLGGFLKTGVDEIHLTYSNKLIFDKIQKVLKKEFIGFIITEQGTNECLIKSISTDSEKDLPSLIQRNFLIVLSLANNLHDLMKKKDFKQINQATFLHESSNQAIGLCQRIIIKNSYTSIANASFKVALLENLELIGDCYEDLCDISSSYAKPFKNEKKVLELVDEINSLLRRQYNLVFDYKSDGIIALIQDLKRCRGNLEDFQNNASRDELKFLFNLQMLTALIKNFFPTMTALYVDKIRSVSPYDQIVD